MRKKYFQTTDQLYYILDGQKAKQWIGYSAIKLDLEFVLQQLDLLKSFKEREFKLQKRNETIIKGLWISVIITYSKSFTDASKGRGVRLQKTLFKKDNKEHLELHEEVMNIRHNYFAHAGTSNFEKMEPRIRLLQRDNGYIYPHLVYHGYTIKGFDQNVITKFIALTNSVNEHVNQRIRYIGAKILSEESQKYTTQEMLLKIQEQHQLDLQG